MKYSEEIRDLFSVDDDYYLAHCISADFAMGKGIAREFDERFDMRHQLRVKYPRYMQLWRMSIPGDALMIGRVFNLVTKERYYQKPTYDPLRESLEVMKNLAIRKGIEKIAMPKIGCGLDRLRWDKVSEMIQDVFENTDIEILVCLQ